MTGPGVFTKAIQMIQEMNGDVKCTGFPQIHYDITDEFEWVSPNEIKYKIYGIDYGKKLKCCIVEEYDALYQNKTHWRHDKRDLLL
jgi:hypothetical protein